MEMLTCRDAQTVLNWSRFERPQKEKFRLHVHPDDELLIFLEGRGRYLVEGHTYVLHPGDVMMMRAGESHMLLIEEGSPYERICINFDAHALSSVDPGGLLLRPLNDRGLGENNKQSLEHPDLFFVLMRRLRETEDPQECSFLVRLCLMELLSDIYHSFCREQKSGRVPSHTAEDLAVSVITYLNTNLTSPLSLQATASHFYISVSQLNRLMKRSVGTTFWDYVRAKRLLAAKSLIRQGVFVCDAAAACGFGDYSAFFRAYKKYFGASPQTDVRPGAEKKRKKADAAETA